jgi:hypothetical protein
MVVSYGLRPVGGLILLDTWVSKTWKAEKHVRRKNMLAPSVNNQTMYNANESGRMVTAVAILIGLLAGGALNMLWDGLPLLAALAMWPLGLAVSFILVALVHYRRTGDGQWGLALAGQALGVLAVAMFFFASLF